MSQVPPSGPAQSEATGDTQADNHPGLYVHEGSGTSLVATTTAAADAYTRLGYVWQRDIQDSDFAALDLAEDETPVDETPAPKKAATSKKK